MSGPLPLTFAHAHVRQVADCHHLWRFWTLLSLPVDPRRSPILPCFSCIHVITCLVLARILASGCLKRRPLVVQACRRRLLENVAARDLAVQRPLLGRYRPPTSLAIVSHLPGTDIGREITALPTILGTCRRSSPPFPVLRTRKTYRLRLWTA